MPGPSQNWLAQGFPAIDPSWGAPQPPAGPPPPPASPALPPPVTLESAIAQANGGAPPPQAPTAPAAVPPQPELAPAPPPGPPMQTVGYSPEEEQGLPPDVQFRAVGGGVAPAREMSIRGPQQNAHLMASYEAPLEANDRINARSQMQAEREALVYQDQAREALARKEAMDRVAIQRSDEMRAMQADFEDTVQQLGKMKLDGQRVWANASTGDKIGTAVTMFLGGLFGGRGENKVETALNKRFDEDIEAQKFDYQRGLDVARGQQTAFGMAMQRYQNEDAAYSAARAAAIDYTLARVNEKVAQGRGVAAANLADELTAKLLADRERTIAEGLKFIPSSVAAPRYKMTIRGQEIPGTVSESTAQGYAVEHGVKPVERVDEKLVEGGIQSTIAQQKIRAEQAAKGQENLVSLPNGETIVAPSSKEADALRELSTTATQVKRLVAEAKQIREQSMTGVPLTPSARGRLKQIQADLVTGFGVQNKLGALSNEDMKLAVAGTADLFNFGNGVEARLDRLNESAISRVSARVATYPGAPPKSSGKMPGSWNAHGSKK